MFIVPFSHSSSHLARSVDRFFDGLDNSRSPALDVAETDSAYSVTLDLPGVAKDDVKVSVDGRRVTVQAQGKTGTAKSDKSDNGDRIIYRERAAVNFSRSFRLPVEVNQSESGAKLENGVLTLTLAKRNATGAAQITVN